MTQGWTLDIPGQTITFDEVPALGTAITVREYNGLGAGASSVWAKGAWGPLNGYPAEVEFYSDRLWFACTYHQPQTLWSSKVGSYIDYGRSVPGLDSDAIVIQILARQANPIRDLVPLTDLLVMTTSAEWRLTTGADEVVAPGKVGFRPQSFYGASDIATQVVGDTAIFVQGRGNIVRDLGFDLMKEGYTGKDLTIYASHLVENHTIVDVAYQQAPYSCVWMVRSDGALICLTYVKEQEVVGWSLHHTDGFFESVCTVPEGDGNAVYVTVRRFVGGVERVSLERLDPRNLADPRDGFFVDAGLTYDGRSQPGTQTLSGGTYWTVDEELTLTRSVAGWVGSTDVGDEVRLVLETEVRGIDGELEVVQESVKLEVIQYVDPNTVRVRAQEDVPVQFRDVPITVWELLRDTVAGLGHLEGASVAVVADGNVQASKVVAAGKITLDHPAAVVHVGLGYTCLIESLDINVQGAETVRDKPKLVKSVALLVDRTRGLKSGSELNLLDDFKVREFEAYDQSVRLLSGIMDVNTAGSWDQNGHFYVLQDQPLPATILSMIPDVAVSGVG